jgi:predicted nucleotidyltransferase
VVHDLKTLGSLISAECEKEPAVMAAYIFGSMAKKGERKPRDVDVALLLEPSKKASFDFLSFVCKLEDVLNCPTDVVILNNADDLLKFHVRRDGLLVFERDSRFRKNFEILGRKTYEDFMYLHNRYVKKVLYGDNNG